MWWYEYIKIGCKIIWEISRVDGWCGKSLSRKYHENRCRLVATNLRTSPRRSWSVKIRNTRLNKIHGSQAILHPCSTYIHIYICISRTLDCWFHTNVFSILGHPWCSLIKDCTRCTYILFYFILFYIIQFIYFSFRLFLISHLELGSSLILTGENCCAVVLRIVGTEAEAITLSWTHVRAVLKQKSATKVFSKKSTPDVKEFKWKTTSTR